MMRFLFTWIVMSFRELDHNSANYKPDLGAAPDQISLGKSFPPDHA